MQMFCYWFGCAKEGKGTGGMACAQATGERFCVIAPLPEWSPGVWASGRRRSQQGSRGLGRASPRWGPWLSLHDVMRNMKSLTSFLHTEPDSLCPLGTFSTAYACVEAEIWFCLFLDCAFGV